MTNCLSLPGSYFVLSMMDRLWRPDLTEEEAVQLMEKGIEEVRPPLVHPLHKACISLGCKICYLLLLPKQDV